MSAASGLLDHPRPVYLREVDLLPHLDGWLTGLFYPPPSTRSSPPARTPAAPPRRSQGSSGRWPTATARLPRYRAALDAEAMISAVSVQLTARQESIYDN
jgi:hypothetical protein